MNIQSTSMASRARLASQATPPQQGQQEQQEQAPAGDSFARHTSEAMTDYGVYALAGAGGFAGLKVGGLIGVAIGAAVGTVGGGVPAAVMVGTACGIAGAGLGAYGGLKLGGKALEMAGNVGEKTMTSNPNVGKAAAQAVALGGLSAISGGPMVGLGVVGLCAAVGGYDTLMAK